MKFTLEGGASAYLIRGYSTSEIHVGEQRVTASCIVTPERLLTDWGPATFAAFGPEHVPTLLGLSAELILIGTGMTQEFAPPAVRRALAAHAIGLEAMELGAACRTFNVLLQEGRRVAAVLFLR